MSRFGQQRKENTIGNRVRWFVGIDWRVNTIRSAYSITTAGKWKNVPSSTTEKE